MTDPHERPRDDANLDAALRDLPSPRIDPDHTARAARQARAAFTHAFEERSALSRVFGSVARVALPAVLAGVVGVYLTWAIATASALLR